MNNTKFNNELFHFIEQSTCAFTGIQEIKKILMQKNYIELEENKPWNLQMNKNYFITRNDSSLIAFQTGSNNSFNMSMFVSFIDNLLH